MNATTPAGSPDLTTILIADDHQLMREGLRALLEHEPDMRVIGEAEHGRRAVERAIELKPDIVVMDIGMPELNGLEATRQIVRETTARVVALSTFADRRYVRAMLEAGARAYVVKSAAADELVRAIHATRSGRIFLSPDVAGGVVEGFLKPDSGEDGTAGASGLGSREREVLQLLAEGRSSPEIAAVLHISVSTVETHRRNIMKKLDLHSVAELTKFAIREGITGL